MVCYVVGHKAVPWGRLLAVPTTAISCVLAATAACGKHQHPSKDQEM